MRTLVGVTFVLNEATFGMTPSTAGPNVIAVTACGAMVKDSAGTVAFPIGKKFSACMIFEKCVSIAARACLMLPRKGLVLVTNGGFGVGISATMNSPDAPCSTRW